MDRQSVGKLDCGGVMNNIIGSNDVVYNKWYKPADWTDIQSGAVANSINLLVGVVSDFSAYNNLGFKVTCVGGYDVYIDGELFGQYLSTALCTITWSTYSATEGSTTTYPVNLITHEVSIRPTVPDTAMTKFNCERITAVTPELQGILWVYFNITNTINLANGFCIAADFYRNQILESVTAKNNILNVNGLTYCFKYAALKYLPVLDGGNSTMSGDSIFARCYILKSVNIKNTTFSTLTGAFFYNYLLEKINFTNITVTAIGANIFPENRSLKKLPTISFTGRTDLTGFIINAKSLLPLVLDVRGSTALTRIGCYGTATYFMTGFKGLRVSSSAPFSSATAPQINVSYTGMDRTALVQLFTDLATVVEKTISVVGCTGTASLTAEDLAIATDKGWTVAV